MLSLVSTWMGDRLGTLGAVGFYFSVFTIDLLLLLLLLLFLCFFPHPFCTKLCLLTLVESLHDDCTSSFKNI